MDIQVIAIKALQLLGCFCILVTLHEGGHFGFSKLFKVKVEKFYLFFNYKFHLFSTRDKWFTRLFPYFKTNETEYGIGWIPLGGYVKIAGMIDESLDTDQMAQPAQPHEFRSQKVWKRMLILAGGVLMNLLTAWFIYSAALYTWGHEYIPMRSMQEGFQYNEFAQELGFRDGDIPVAADGDPIEEYTAANIRTLSNAGVVTVLRDGKEVDLQMPEGGLNMLELVEMQPAFMVPYMPAVVDSVMPGSAAAKGGITAGCRLLEADRTPLRTWGDYDNQVVLRRQDVLSSPDCTAADSLRLRSMEVVFATPDGQRDTALLQLDDNYMMGLTRQQPVYEVARHEYTLAQSVPAGLQYGWKVLSGYVNDLKYVASKKGAQSVGSFVTIGSIFPATWDWQQFWMLTAFISIILAVMNLLPIPGLDGGQLVLQFYELVTGHAPSDTVMLWLERIGIVIILGLMLLGFGNDIMRFVLPAFNM